jgi:uncharacterized protein (DUF2141 family)
MKRSMFCSRAQRRASTLAFVAFAIVASARFSAAAQADDGATIKVTISGFKGTEGQALVTLYDGAATWLKIPKAVQVLRLKITGPTLTVEFKGVKPGTYAVSVVHDANKNNEMDMRWLPWPKPKEGAASSNDQEVVKGPPKWELAKFDVAAAGISVKATLHYFD